MAYRKLEQAILTSEHLPLFDDHDSYDEHSGETKSASARAPMPNPSINGRKTVIIASLVAFLCTLVNLGLLLVWQKVSVPPKQNVIFSEYQGLEIANSYVNLDTAIYDIPRVPPKPISNYPLVVSRVNWHEPKKVYIDSSSWMSALGLIYPEEHAVGIKHHQSTIMQYRALDYGMERCTVVLSLPSHQILSQADPPKHSAHTKGSIIDVWKLKASSRLDPLTVSWASRPARDDRLFSFTILPNVTSYESPEFFCRSGSLHSFEFGCADDSSTANCMLEFTQDNHQPQLAFFIRQRSSI
ncbi:hypothetical protein FA15DRAFT_641384 [Coprinopsis marcescibilis]|uniref:Ubiquitin 3 binding protein But2 C-terminal domain-containing protein n=1 Tax=Coprinopsis marcescibilis TaxID=230819 RepID=A0A5C3KUB0_COPMA|nr:hypothetical protein FA15DRAFT_641384 [Coprinopsis marcescibilis]